MTGKKPIVELYLNSNKGVLMDRHRQNMPPFRQIYGKKSQTWESQKEIGGLTDSEEELLGSLRALSGSGRIVLRVYDVDKWFHFFRAKKRGVRHIPTVFVNNKRLEGKIDKSQIMKCIR